MTRSQVRKKSKRLHFEDEPEATVQEERRRRISKAQDEEQRWPILKAIISYETETMSYKDARDAWKWCDKFILSSNNILYYVVATRRKSEDDQPELVLRLVVPTTMIQEVLQNCHDSIEGCHQGVIVKHDYYWIGLYADVGKHVKSCLDSSSSKSASQLKGYSPGNSDHSKWCDGFCHPATEIASGQYSPTTQTVLVRWPTSSKSVPKFFSPSLIRHDRDPLFMGEVLRAFAELIQARTWSKLSCCAQASVQQERSMIIVTQAVKVYVEDPLHQDWDEIAERLAFAINNSHDMRRKKTPFCLVH
ncbi:reverse transcriptase [Phytophthora megakarya]|uniref:Reverse transcriptase n=1 Tax=Phytophthora megakarya TaxID=4795 RepID=A0A225WRI4_9STRA|nr:reverse transcriptase [Phytophthora megakarya]